ncbi:TetR/AcrR family transcriptional regulator [Mycobacterium sp. 236(2023)]|uniref:TetR/AcrR family transcriptional regulator n=1 Tax=Mycobacterium sp. 236(2023) TaxID=3038163 RepID=UPI0024156E6D|nr:TetR/AcrR family transcriptional regulator [Mycobacterium sp. 236(2023)]MDG4666357.1 TetR/AcrR family transcriptional regulator [Mycobacterium sp. 236(2023)]
MRDARRQMYRQQILIAAEYEFARTGFTESKVTAIASAAGVSLATVYKNFEGKDEIWDVLHAQRMNELVDSVRVVATTVTSPLERLTLGARAQVEFFAAHPNYLALHVKEGLSWATAMGGGDAGRGGQRSTWRAGLEMLTHGVQAAIDAGELPPRKPTIVAALMISALQVWLTDWFVNDRDRPATDVADDFLDYLNAALLHPAKNFVERT